MAIDQDNCDTKCGSCPLHGDCSKEKTLIPKSKMEPYSSARHVIGIVSGKGGVGKSFSTSYLACALTKLGYKVGILDADITGPSIPFAFNMNYKALASEEGIMLPGESKRFKIKIISSNMLLNDNNEPIIFRGPLLGDLVIQFYEKVYYQHLDYLLIDMPPGTADIALTIFQKIPLDGIISVTTGQQLTSMIVEKANTMAKIMNIKILGLICNMAYVKCDCCNNEIPLYGKDSLEKLKKEYNIKNTLLLPFDKKYAEYVDKGDIENLDIPEFNIFASQISED